MILRQKTRLSRKPDTWRCTWDADDRLTEVTTPDGTRWRYRYDAMGRRAAKQRLASFDASRETAAKPDEVVEETVFTWDGPTLIEQTTRSAGSPHEVTVSWTHSGLHPLTQPVEAASYGRSGRSACGDPEGSRNF
ncbi:RHS repeat domain-containing protein [Streptomyces erythrochromogenes]|uniref:RHS repeat domain-containing protein n=1 Tax=Streptomyces erythrochromogenes TaxID=285574 RepID=UPI00382A4BF5